MALKGNIDSRVTGLRFLEEAGLKTPPSTLAHQVWFPVEPNSYGDFGGSVVTVARNPISESRQNLKGVTTDLDASGGIVQDITQENLVRLMQGFMFADAREKADTAGFSRERTFNADGTEDAAPTTIAITGVTAVAYQAASGLDAFVAGDLVLSTDFVPATNNGFKVVDTGGIATNLPIVGGGMTIETPAAAARIRVVGHQYPTGDLSVDVDAALFPVINSASNAFLNQALIPGEWIFNGGDSAATQFDTAIMQGYARIRAVAADGSSITLDKTQQSWGTVDDPGTGKTIQLFFGLVIKNESNADLQITRSYQLERRLGKPDDTLTGDQAEYLVGSIANEMTFNIPTADKATVDLGFIALDNETHNENDDGGTTPIKSQRAGVTAPAIIQADAFNTSSDVARIRIGSVSASDSFPAAFFGFAQELTLSINNNASPNKAIGTLGGFSVTIGNFVVSGTTTAYFQSVSAIQSVRSNDDITLDIHLVKANAGISFDIPLLTLGDARPNVELDQPVTLPLGVAAASGAKINSALDHTLLVMFFPYLPSLAG